MTINYLNARWEICLSRKVICYGAGQFGKVFATRQPWVNIAYFVDSDRNKWGERLGDHLIESPDCLFSEKPDSIWIFITSIFYEEISSVLSSMGFKEGVDFGGVSFSESIDQRDQLFEQLIGCCQKNHFPSITFQGKQGKFRKALLRELLGTSVVEGLYIVNFIREALAVKGDICEFGVAQGATSALIANEVADETRLLWLFDSFQGLPMPSEKDVLTHDIFDLKEIANYQGTMKHGQEEVRLRLSLLGFPMERVRITEGFLEETLVGIDGPDCVAFAYVDLDFYEPTKFALTFLEDKLSVGGYIVVDDYGFFSSGVKTAVDEFLLKRRGIFVSLSPVSFAGDFIILRKLGFGYSSFREG